MLSDKDKLGTSTIWMVKTGQNLILSSQFDVNMTKWLFFDQDQNIWKVWRDRLILSYSEIS